MKLHSSRRKMLRADPKKAGFWQTLLYYVVVFALSELLRPKPELEDSKPAGLGDFQFPTATEDRSVPLLWGTVMIKGANVVWYGNLVQEAITEKIKTGLFSSETITKGYKYKVGVQHALCRGTLDALLRVWVAEDLVFTGTVTDGGTFNIDKPELFGGDELGNGGFGGPGGDGTFVLRSGSLTQSVDPYLAQFQKVGPNNRTPAYRGTAFVTSDSGPIYVGNSSSIKPMKWEVRRLPNGLALSGDGSLNSGNDINPMNMIHEVLTDSEWGLNQASSRIDLVDFQAAAATLLAEGNGISYLLDSPIEAVELIALVEEQVDGILLFNQKEQQYQFVLARADYDIDLVPVLDETNILKVNSFARGSWEDTTNVVRSKYNDRDDEYKGTFGLAQDSANIRIQEGSIITATRNYPGCKSGVLANQLAWRDLRTLSYPLAKASITMDRSFWDTTPGQVFAYTDADLGLIKLPVRVTRVDLGELEDNKVKLDLVQDVFYFQLGSFGAPGGTGWEPPADSLLPFAGSEQVMFECPRGFNVRDPKSTGPADNRVFTTARRVGIEVGFRVKSKLASAAQASYVTAETGVSLIKIGELFAALSREGGTPMSFVIVPTPDSQLGIVEEFDAAPSVTELGTNLSQLIIVGDELMLVQDASNTGANVTLSNVYRGVLDTVRGDFASGTDVFILAGATSAGGVTSGSFGESDALTFRLLPFTALDEVLLASSVEVAVTMDKRSRRPYPPSRILLNSVAWDTTDVSLDQLGGGAESVGIDVDWLRRDYRTGDGADEIPPLSADASTLFGDFPSANSTVHTLEVWNLTGSPTLLLTFADLTPATQDVLRIDILEATGGTLPTDLRCVLRAKHDDGAETLEARSDLTHDFDIASALEGQFEFGANGNGVTSAIYTATVAGTYAFTLSSAFSVGDVEYRVNAGAWTVLIAGGGTTGNIAGIVATDQIKIRHWESPSSILKQIDMVAPGAGQDAFGLFID